jgi:uncharacterized protein YxeA
MIKQALFSILFSASLIVNAQISQTSDKLYEDNSFLKIKMSYSNKEMNKKTNDSTLIKVPLEYFDQDKWNTIEVSLRARGNFRRNKCYFPPIKMKIKKEAIENTLFEGNKTMKLVMPCKLEKENNDNILQEFIAYKMYELTSPYHFKTRFVEIDFTEPKGRKIKEFKLNGFLIEDDKVVAKRFEAKVLDRFMHPMSMDALTSVQNSFFQFLLGNTDFSTAYQHNGKLLYIDKKIVPLPYDFDMTGWVNPSYQVVNETLNINSVRDRKYRGFKRDTEVFNQVRDQFISKKSKLMDLLISYEDDFEDPKEFIETKEFLESFYEIIENDKSYKKKIVDAARTK